MHEYGLGWRPSYVEISGYIVETFYDVAKAYNDPNAAVRAEKLGRWLITVQQEDGSFSNNSMEAGSGLVFDTGQVLFGLTRCYKETGDTQFMTAAKKAALWLCKQQDKDGAFRKSTHKNNVHSYNARSAWAMLDFAKTVENKTIEALAHKNLIWTIGQQTDFNQKNILNCGFHAVTEKDVLDWFTAGHSARRARYITTVNVAILMMMRKNDRLQRFVDDSDLTVADGLPIIWLSKLLRRPLPERVTGVDLCHKFCGLAAQAGHSVYLLGRSFITFPSDKNKPKT